MSKDHRPGIYWYLFKQFITIGSLSFGGYLPLVAMIKEKLVEKDRLVEESRITEAIALGSLLPGPLAVNVTAYISFLLAGVPGAFVAIFSVLLPSFVLVSIFSQLYFNFGIGVAMNHILVGVLPVILAIIFSMSFKMFKTNCRSHGQKFASVLSLVLLLLFPGYLTVFLIILGSAIAGIIFFSERPGPQQDFKRSDLGYIFVPVLMFAVFFILYHSLEPGKNIFIFGVFAKTSLTLFGGGYVMIPILELLLVNQLQLLSANEFLVGISIGHLTPGPILISAAFFGYKMNGFLGSLAAVSGIFLPSALLMVVASKFYSLVAGNPKVKSAMNGVKPAIVGMIVYSGISLALGDRLFGGIQYLVLFSALAFIVIEVLKINMVKAVVLGVMAGCLYFFISQ